jgi:hypothetical protein
MEAIHLVLPDGRVLAGHAAIPEILRHLNGWRGLAALFRLPGVRWLAPAAHTVELTSQRADNTTVMW